MEGNEHELVRRIRRWIAFHVPKQAGLVYVNRGTPFVKLSLTASSFRTGGVSMSRSSEWKIRVP